MSDVGVLVPSKLHGVDPDETIALAKRAENAGFHSIWKGETSAMNTAMLLTAIARETESVRIGTAILNVYSRSPTLLAMSIATLDELSDGRAILGLGTSSKTIVEQFHGQPYTAPLRRLREAIEIVREASAHERFEYDGEIFEVGPYTRQFSTVQEEIPIFNAALGETNRELTSEFANGWIPLFIPKRAMEDEITEMRRGVESNGRSPDEFTVAPFIPAAMAEDTETAKRRVKGWIAQEMAMGYNRALERYGFGAAANKAAKRWRAGDREAASESISDEIVDEFAIFGTPSEFTDDLSEFQAAGVDLPILWPAPQATADEFRLMIDEAV